MGGRAALMKPMWICRVDLQGPARYTNKPNMCSLSVSVGINLPIMFIGQMIVGDIGMTCSRVQAFDERQLMHELREVGYNAHVCNTGNIKNGVNDFTQRYTN